MFKVVFYVVATRIISAAWLPLLLNISHEWTGFQIISMAGAEKMMIFIKGRRIVRQCFQQQSCITVSAGQRFDLLE